MLNPFGSIYREGTGLPVDYSSARQWFDKAAAQSYPEAELALGDLYSIRKARA